MSPSFTPSRLKFPSTSVILPFVVPLITTDAPATGPKSSSTTPLTFPVCWVIVISLFSDAESAYTLVESGIAPAIRIKLTGLNCFNIIDKFIDNTRISGVAIRFDVCFCF